MKLFGTALLASAVVAEYDYYEGERGKKKGGKGKKPAKRDACGCDLNPRNAPDAVPTCVDDSNKRKVIDWTCAATGLVERTETKCKRLRKKDLAEPCGDLGCRCASELAAFSATVAGSAIQCRRGGKKTLYKFFCDDDGDGVFDQGEASQINRVKCKNGELRRNKFTLTCGGGGGGGGGAITQNADGTGGTPPAIKSYVTVDENSSPTTIGVNAKAIDADLSADGAFIAAGLSVANESSTVRQFFVTKIKTCSDKTQYTNPLGTILTGAGADCAQNFDWSFLKTGNACNAVTVKESLDGSYVLAAGLHQSTGVAGTYNGYVVKLNAADGSMIWEFDYTTDVGARSGFETLHLTSDGGFIVGGFINRGNSEYPTFKSGGQVDDGTPVLMKFSNTIASGSSVSSPEPDWKYVCDGSNKSCNLNDGSMKNMRVYTDNAGEKIAALPTSRSILCIVSGATGAEIAYSGDAKTTGFIGDGTANDIEVVIDGDGEVEGFVVTGLRDKKISSDGGVTCTGDGCKVIDGFIAKYKPDLSGKIWDTLLPTSTWPGGINQFAGTQATFESLVYTECWGMDKVKDTSGNHVGFVAACGTGIEPGCGIHPGAIGTACSTDPRTAWRGAIARFDLSGNLVWYRMDSFNAGSGTSGESASEYIFQDANGNIISLTDEGFGGFGFETLELESL